MYNGIGLPTPRGSGTNGYVQKNLAFINSFKEQQPYKTDEDIKRSEALLFKEPNKEILEHERKRKIEVKCFEMEQEMEEQGYTQTEIDLKVGGFRKKLLEELKAAPIEKKPTLNIEPFEAPQSETGRLVPKGTHETAAVTILKNTVFKEALGIGEEFQDGNSMDLASQRKKEEAETKRLIEAQKDLKTVDTSEESSDNEENKEKRHHKKKLKKRKSSRSRSRESVTSEDSSHANDSHHHRHHHHHRKHKSDKKSHSKKSKHGHPREKHY